MRAESEERKARATAWFATLRDQICGAFERLETESTGTGAPAGRFERKSWTRPAEPGSPSGGGGVLSVMRGRVFEKVGVYVSTVEGEF